MESAQAIRDMTEGGHDRDHTPTLEFDARADAEAYVANRLGPSPWVAKYSQAFLTLIMLSFGLVFFGAGVVMFGLPPPSTLGVLAPFFAWIAVWAGVSVYYIRLARVKSSALPDAYTVDAEGIYIHRPDGTHEWIDWDEPKLYFWMIDQRHWSTPPRGTTRIVKENISYPVPAPMFDLVLHRAREKGLAGSPRSYLSTRGKLTRTIIARSARLGT